jgi:hypothetical protein
VQRNASCRVGFQLVPEFHVSQNGGRAQVLELIRRRLGCGYIKPNSRRSSQTSFEHLLSATTAPTAGFRRLLEVALSMNGGGRFRKVRWNELVAVQNPQRLHARQGREARKIQSELHGDMQSQAEMTWPPSVARE